MGPEKGWLSAPTIGSGVVALGAFVAFVVVERTAENPIVPFDLFFDRNRLATFATIFLAGGVLFTLTVLITLYVQNIMGYSALRAGAAFVPFALAVGVGAVASSKLVTRFPPRVLVIAGGILLVGAMLYSSTLHRGIPYFPNLVMPLVVGGIGIGLANVPLGLSVIAGVGSDRIGPTSAISLMLLSLGGPVVMAVIQAVVTSHTLSLGGTSGPAKSMNPAQLHALDQGYTYGLLWLAGVSVLVGVAAAVHRLHRGAGGASAASQKSHRRRETVGLIPASQDLGMIFSMWQWMPTAGWRVARFIERLQPMPESRCIQGDLASSASADSGDIAADHQTLHIRLDRLAAPRQTAASANSAKPQQYRQRLIPAPHAQGATA